MKKIIFLLPLLILFACPLIDYPDYNTPEFPEQPVNFEEINSEYDDYNSAAPFIRDVFPLCFSSNRGSFGGQMDIEYKLIALDFDKESEILTIYNETNSNLDVVSRYNPIYSMINQANSLNDELGPNIMYQYDEDWTLEFLLLFAKSVENQLDIHYIHDFGGVGYLSELNSVNSDSDDAYPSFTDSLDRLVFCSNRNGDFDIMAVDWDNSVELEIELEKDSIKTIENLDVLNSDADDKCPYIDGNILVFTSNRPGGYGGYDLYYSLLKEGIWSEPVNMGPTINSDFDEYRPLLKNQPEFGNDFLLFSSNRPGGMGGFDLYYCGVNFE